MIFMASAPPVPSPSRIPRSRIGFTTGTAAAAATKGALSVARAAGLDRAVLTTGRRSERFSQEYWCDLPEEAFVQIGDFFKMSLESAVQKGFNRITLAVFFGKALKMAQAIPHTHAAKASLTLEKLHEVFVDMQTTVFIGSRASMRYMDFRGYAKKYKIGGE